MFVFMGYTYNVNKMPSYYVESQFHGQFAVELFYGYFLKVHGI